jgi:hypothetical protein
VATVLLAGVLSTAEARADGYASDAGMGTAAVLVNLLYVPAKLVYAGLGGLTGGVAYCLTGGNFEIADRIWAPSLGGNYLVTPAHLRNEQTLYFSGVVEPEAARSSSSFPPPPRAPTAPAAERTSPGTLGGEPHDPSQPPEPVSPPRY